MSDRRCPSCGGNNLETYHVCDDCGDDYTGGAMAKVIDSHTATLRAALAEAQRERDEYRANAEAAETVAENRRIKRKEAESRLAAAVEVLREVVGFIRHRDCDWAIPDCSCGYRAIQRKLAAVLAREGTT